MVASQKALDEYDAMAGWAVAEGEKWGVSSQISNQDQLLGAFIRVSKMTPAAALSAYFSGGYQDAHQVFTRINEHPKKLEETSVLEFASGFGRVTRHLTKLMPAANLTISDIHDEACQFAEENLGVRAVVSSTNPDDIRGMGKFDFICVLSLFSHLPIETFGKWLEALFSLLNKDGQLLFTTHGEHAMKVAGSFFAEGYDAQRGFGYRTESDQADLSSDDYGTAVVSIPFVYDLVSKIPGAEILSIRSGIWFGLQDEWIIRKGSVPAPQ